MMVVSNGFKRSNPKYKAGSWHTGETLYMPPGPVITFQCDGDELYFVLQALAKAGITVIDTDGPLTPIF